MTNVTIFQTLEEIEQYDFKNKTNKELLFENFTKVFNKESKKVYEPKFKFSDKITIKFNNKNIDTTIGRLIFNKFTLPDIYLNNIGYCNDELTKKRVGGLISDLSNLVLSKKLSEKDYADFLDRIGWLGSTLSVVSGEGFDSNSFRLSKEVEAMLNQFLSSPKDKLNDPEYVKIWTDKIIDEIKGTMSDRSLVRIINAGLKGDYGNNFKNMILFRGIVDGEFIPDNLANGNSYSTYTELGKNAVEGSSSRAIKTAQGGYATKLMANGYNFMYVAGDDCKTKEYLTVRCNDPNEYLYRLVRIKGRNVPFNMLEKTNMSEYKGKVIEVRSPMYCKDPNGICKKCMGGIVELSNIKYNLSAFPISISSDIMMKSMKSFHNLEKSYTKINFKEHFSPQNKR